MLWGHTEREAETSTEVSCSAVPVGWYVQGHTGTCRYTTIPACRLQPFVQGLRLLDAQIARYIYTRSQLDYRKRGCPWAVLGPCCRRNDAN